MRAFIIGLTKGMSIIAGIVLIFMMVLTFSDIILRFMGRPILGVYEIVSLLGLFVMGFALPRSSLKKTHIALDFLVERMSGTPRRILRIVTRILGFFLFVIAGWYLVKMGKNFYVTNTLSQMLRAPIYPVVFGVAFSCFVQSVVSIYEIFGKEGVTNE